MASSWEILERAGVPMGTRRDAPDLSDRCAIARAVRDVLLNRQMLAERERLSLFAWLRAWASDWPASFADTFGGEAAEVLAQASDGVDDGGRYLKLRRIAREHLARAL